MTMHELFGTKSNNTTANARSLPGTAELTNVATAAAHDILQKMEADIVAYKPRIQKSSVDYKELDALLDELLEYEIEDDSVLRNLTDEQVESMLKSQQSKRSRAKSKTMTMDNYIALLTAAIAENILREIYNRPKAAVGYSRKAGAVDFTGAQLEMLAEDQEALRREIRNIQSKKSIMKSKADFSESDERWIALLKAEQQLKDLRVGGRSGTVVEVDRTKDALSDLLAGRDFSKMSPEEAASLLASIQNLAMSNVDEATADDLQ